MCLYAHVFIQTYIHAYGYTQTCVFVYTHEPQGTHKGSTCAPISTTFTSILRRYFDFHLHFTWCSDIHFHATGAPSCMCATGPPSSRHNAPHLWPSPILVRNSLEPFPSQMWMSLSRSRFALVAPEMNHTVRKSHVLHLGTRAIHP